MSSNDNGRLKVERAVRRLAWVECAKALALLGILLNHFVEEFRPGPWFTNPSNDWPALTERLQNIYPPDDGTPVITFIQFLGWLGDSCPGVFILLSGFGLAWSHLIRNNDESLTSFYTKRAFRIYPLYIAIHFVILAGALFVPAVDISIASTKTFLSMLGLRFAPSLFFYISPAWWFVWLIVQLYVIFPFLIRWLQKQGLPRFLLLSLVFTVLCRLYGILFSGHLYFWMTGMFFGTRLAEFTLGMGLAYYLLKERQRKETVPVKKILAPSAGLYALGFTCSLFLYGSLISNFLVTAGMTGIFYCLWEGAIRRFNILDSMMKWIGERSYGVFLLHQAPLMWTGMVLEGGNHVLAAAAVIALSFPAAALIMGVVDRRLPSLIENTTLDGLSRWAIPVSGIALAVTMFVEPLLGSTRLHDAAALILGVMLLYLLVAEYRVRRLNGTYSPVRCAAILALVITLFVFATGNGFMAATTALILVFFAGTLYHATKSRLAAFSISAVACVVLFVVLEVCFARCLPLEMGQWGELPALEKHPTRMYALKPDRQTRLRYNNYDYIVKTNSLGLASPEISRQRPAADTLRILVIGDAFSMPEGLQYEQAYPAKLEAIISGMLEPRKVQVINAGVTGYGPLQQYPQLIELLPIFKPDIVVYEYFINEFEDIQHNQAALLKSIGLTQGRLAQLNLIKRSHFLEHSRRFYLDAAENITGITPSWKYGKSLLQFYRTGNNDLYAESNISKMYKYLRLMNEACLSHGARMVIYFVPGAISVLKPQQITYFPRNLDLMTSSLYDLERPLRELRAIADPLMIPVVDLTGPLKAHDQQTYFSESWHWNSEGHTVVAQTIARDLSIRGLLGDLGKDKHGTSAKGSTSLKESPSIQ